MWDGSAFSGTKIALLCAGQLVTYLRDEKPDIPFPGMWDLPGGGREGEESPLRCGLREVEEEFGLSIPEDRVHFLERHPSQSANGLDTYFCAAHIREDEIGNVVFGDEGQRWRMMDISAFLKHDNAIPHLKRRLSAYLERFDVEA